MFEGNKAYQNAVKRAAHSVEAEKFCNKKVLVTGSTGLIGTPLTDCLLSLGAFVFAAARTREEFFERFCESEKLCYYEYDLMKELKEGEFDYIIHAASNADPKMFDKEPVITMTANFIGAYNLLEHLRKQGHGRLIYISTGEVYGQYDGKSDAFSEDYSGYVNFTEPRGCYPSSKRAAENLAVCYKAQYGTDFVTVRLSHTYGPTQRESDSRAMSEFFRLAAKGSDIVLRSKGETVRSYTCVFDAVSAILTAAAEGKSGEAYNCANRNSVVSIGGLAEAVAKSADVNVIYDIGDVKGAGNIARGVLDGSKLEAIGWVPMYDLERGVKITLDVLQEDNAKK